MAADIGIDSLLDLYRLTAVRVPKVLDGVADDDLLRAPEGTNHLLWCWGHLTNTRCSLLRALGADRELFHPELFGKGSEPAQAAEYPSVEEIERGWNAATAQLEARLEEMTVEELAQPAPRDFPVADKTLRGTVAFLAFHEAYHLGQMGLVRKWLGLGRLSG